MQLSDLAQHTGTQSAPCKNCPGNCCSTSKLNEHSSEGGETDLSNTAKKRRNEHERTESMIGQMMQMPLTISSLIDHGARYHSDTEIISIETDKTKTRNSWTSIAKRSRRLCLKWGSDMATGAPQSPGTMRAIWNAISEFPAAVWCATRSTRVCSRSNWSM